MLKYLIPSKDNNKLDTIEDVEISLFGLIKGLSLLILVTILINYIK